MFSNFRFFPRMMGFPRQPLSISKSVNLNLNLFSSIRRMSVCRQSSPSAKKTTMLSWRPRETWKKSTSTRSWWLPKTTRRNLTASLRDVRVSSKSVPSLRWLCCLPTKLNCNIVSNISGLSASDKPRSFECIMKDFFDATGGNHKEEGGDKVRFSLLVFTLMSLFVSLCKHLISDIHGRWELH